MLAQGRPSDLIRHPHVTPVGTRRVEAEHDGGVALLLEKSFGLDYVSDATIFGNSLHLLMDGAVDDARLARDLAADSGAVKVREIDPSLEDVFVRLTKVQSARDKAA